MGMYSSNDWIKFPPRKRFTFQDFCAIINKGGQKPCDISRPRWNACQTWFLNRISTDDFTEDEREHLSLYMKGIL